MNDMPRKGKQASAGRPRVLETDEGREKVAKLLQALRGGNFREVACEWAGIPERTFRAWMQEGEAGAPQSSVDFCRQVMEAEKAAEIRNVAFVMKAAEEDPKHAEWWLERKHPERWGRKERHELTGAGGGALQVETTSSLALLADPEACALATKLISRLSGGEEPIDGPEAFDAGTAD